MTTTKYQEYIKKFNHYPTSTALLTYGLGLGGEAGEVQEKIKKLYRDHGGEITPEFKQAMRKEMGDVLWYLGMICNKLGLDLEGCMTSNIVKLDLREKKDMINGEGDNREEE